MIFEVFKLIIVMTALFAIVAFIGIVTGAW